VIEITAVFVTGPRGGVRGAGSPITAAPISIADEIKAWFVMMFPYW